MKKNFTLDWNAIKIEEALTPQSVAKASPSDQSRASKPANTVVAFPENTSTVRNADFGPFYGQGYDDITAACQLTIEKLVAESVKTKGKSLSVTSIASYWRIGFRYFASFLSLLHFASGEDLTMADLNIDSIKQYLQHLRNEPLEYVAQKNYFTLTKSLLTACHRFGFWPEADMKTVWPNNPFPNSNRRKKSQKAVSKNEKRFLIKALGKEMNRIVAHSEPLSSYDLTVCVLSIALSTGMNPTPILELTTDCVQPHPLKSNLRLLVSFKRRGSATHVVALRKSEEVAEMASIHLYAADAIDLIVSRNAVIRARCNTPNRLLVYEHAAARRAGKPGRLTQLRLNCNTNAFVEQHQLQTDDGKPLILNVSRLRQTLLNRVWEMSGQDPLVAARTGRHALARISHERPDGPLLAA